MTADRRAIAIILARGGSKGVPGKNAAVLAGKPCLLWTIEDARAATTVARVALSTDDAGLARLGRDARAEVVERPAELASDAARVDDAARHAVEQLERTGHGARDLGTPIVILYGNVPVRPRGLIDRAVRTLIETGADSVQSYSPVGKFHPWWTARLGPDGAVRAWEGDVLNHGVFRRQDLPPAFIPDGGVLAVTRAALLLQVPGVAPGPHAFLGRDRRGVATGEGEVVDIDAPLDLVVADAVLRARR